MAAFQLTMDMNMSPHSNWRMAASEQLEQSSNSASMLLLLPAYAALSSVTLLIVHFVLASNRTKSFLSCLRGPKSTVDDSSVGEQELSDDERLASSNQSSKPHIEQLGGRTIFTFMIARVVGSLAFLALSITSLLLVEIRPNDTQKDDDRREGGHILAPLSRDEWLQMLLCLTSVYTTLLAIISVSASLRWSRIATRHFNTITLIAFVGYAYRDLYPLGTYNLTPLDAPEGWLIWAKISVLGFLAVVIPLTIPRQYIPLNPKDPAPEVNPEQTVSLLSLTLYFFMDPIIIDAHRTSHLPYDALPPLADYDYARNLRLRAIQHVDPYLSVKKRRHLFFSLMRVFFKDYLVLSLMMLIEALAGFSTPIGVNNLLAYLETNGEGATIRPWVWILWLFVGPTISSIAFEWYIFIGTRAIVQTESILTQVVFDHALRIRIKAETNENEKADSSSPVSEITSGADTPALAEEETVLDDSEISTLQSATATAVESATSHSSADESADGSFRSKRPGKSAGPEVASTLTPPPPTSAAKPKSDSKNLIGKLNNLVSTDLQNIVDSKDFIRLLIYVPIEVALCVWFLYAVLGWSAFVGLAVIIILFPVPGALAKLTQEAQRDRMRQTDGRVQVVTEIMNVLRMIKMFGWERKMYGRISEKREEELSFVKRLRFIGMTTAIANTVIPVLTMLTTYSTYTLVMKEELNASKVFSSMVVFDKFTSLLSMMMYMITQSLTGKVSLDRITEFLYETELLDSFTASNTQTDLQVFSSAQSSDTNAIGFRHAMFTWSTEYDAGFNTPNKRRFLLNIEDDLIFRQGCINMIIGPTGSGKTSLLMALLSEMHFIPSGLDSWFNLPRDKGVAYAAQESWVQNATIKENIVFGSQFDEERYKKVIYQCCLERDLALLQAGDDTEVGEKGLTLSGGQKARVTLARALYSHAEIILLDDVLAALDVHTSKWIIEKCFKGDLIQGRTVLLVTHNLVLVQPIAGFVVAMKEGRIVSKGSISDAISLDRTLADEAKQSEEIAERAEEEIDPQHQTVADGSKADGKLILAEEVQTGHVSWSSMKLYLVALGGNHVALFFIAFLGFFLTSELAKNGQTWFLGYWASQYNGVKDPSEVNVVFFISIYAAIIILVVGCFSLGYIIYLYGTLRASRFIHKQLLISILGTTLRWLDSTPTSRIITRCTQDIRDIDDPIAQMLATLTQMTLAMIVKFLAVVGFNPAFLVPSVLVAVLGMLCGQIYIRSQLAVRREMTVAKAPVLGHFGAAIAGLISIRAYGAEDAFKKESLVRIDHYSRPARTYYNLNRWVDIRIDALGNLFASSLAAYLVYFAYDSPSNTGFSMNMAVGFSGIILWWVRLSNQFEIRGNSLERIKAYIDIEQEPKSTKEGIPPAFWPSSGELRVEKLAARYSPDGPKVLQDISFNVASGERIGVVGRTGSGKSSLMLALLRCIFTEGNIYYDGLSTTSINLENLRDKITIIPQMPELLSGTVRENLDPFYQHDDAVLNDSLRSAGLFSIQDEDDEGRITLDSAVSSGGNNLSVGQRQILALARAMVRGSKLLILDEATSAIDYKTDTVIQSSLRNELKGDVTLITVAHRLQTIMDADKIMVLEAGRIVEFDSPKTLLTIQGGKLKALVDESADRVHLYEMANADLN